VHAERRAIAAFGRPGPCNLCSGARALLIARKNSKALAKSPACLKGKSSSANLSMCHVEDGKVQAWPRGYRAQSCSRSGIPWARARGQERGRARKSSTCLEARSLQALHPQKDVDFSLRWSVVTQWKGGGAIFIAFFSDPSLKRRTMVEESPCPARPHCLIHLPPPTLMIWQAYQPVCPHPLSTSLHVAAIWTVQGPSSLRRRLTAPRTKSSTPDETREER
jgi:hypothetical protein